MSTRFTTFVIAGAAALSVAACGSSNTSSPGTSSPPAASTAVASPTTTPATPPNGDTQVRGLIASVTGNAVQVTQQNGTATVDFSQSTKITEVTSAALTDVSAGSCVSVRSRDGKQGDQPVTAASVRVSPAVDGKCPQGGEPAPGPSGTPTTGPGKRPAIQGTVASVAGDTITVNTAGATQPVTVTNKTRYTKEGAATSQAITQGKCITAQGSENGGSLQATTISLRPAANGKCSEGSGPHRH
jgi:uncharacterized protein DUF5666